MNVPPQDVITKDNVTMRVDAVIYDDLTQIGHDIVVRVVEPVPAVVKVQNYLFAVSQAHNTKQILDRCRRVGQGSGRLTAERLPASADARRLCRSWA